jgi:hypothetical protein
MDAQTPMLIVKVAGRKVIGTLIDGGSRMNIIINSFGSQLGLQGM